MEILFCILSAVIGYLLGCIPSGVLISRFYGNTDIRASGSGNTGTTNVLRTLGWLPSVLTLIGDCLKGVLAGLAGRWIGGQNGMFIAGICAVLGHDYPVFLHFKGGKGIATSLGVILVACWPVGPCLVAIVVAAVALTHTMSIASLIASVACPLLFWLFKRGDPELWKYLVFSLILAASSFICHRANLVRLVRNRENRLDFGRINRISRQNFRRFREEHFGKK